MREANHKTSPRRLRFRGGNAVLEMALVMPVLIALTFGCVTYGYAMFLKHSLQSASREGARAAIVSGATATDVQNAVDASMLAAGFAQSTYTRPPTISPSNWASSGAGTMVTVTVQTTWGAAGFNVLPSDLGGIASSKIVSGGTTMRKEG